MKLKDFVIIFLSAELDGVVIAIGSNCAISSILRKFLLLKGANLRQRFVFTLLSADNFNK